jgi:hypothetical protein
MPDPEPRTRRRRLTLALLGLLCLGLFLVALFGLFAASVQAEHTARNLPETPTYDAGQSPPLTGAELGWTIGANVAVAIGLGLLVAAIGPQRRNAYRVVAGLTIVALVALNVATLLGH